MAKSRDIKNRIRSVNNTKKITRTMELVATAKAKVAADRIDRANPYFKALADIAREARSQGGVAKHQLLETRPVKKVALLTIVANRGLCGGYNSVALRMARDHRRALAAEGVEVDIIPSGGKAFNWLRYSRIPFNPDGYREFEDKPEYVQTEKVAERLMKLFVTGEVDRVDICYTNFYSAGRQAPVIETLLPISAGGDGDEDQDEAPASDGDWNADDYIIEPDPASILNAIFPMQVKLEVFRAFLCAAASEQIARRVAMKNATDNAEDLSKELKMKYNRARQTQITTEILEIIGGAEALN